MFGTSNWVTTTCPSSSLFQFTHPLSRSSCLRSVSLLSKAGLKHEEYRSVRNYATKGSAAPSEPKTERRLRSTPDLGTAPRPVERMPKYIRSKPCSQQRVGHLSPLSGSFTPLSLDPHKRNLGVFGLCNPKLTQHAGTDKWRWNSKRIITVKGTAMQWRLDCFWPASEALAPFQFYLSLVSTNGYQALHMMEVRDGEPDISRKIWPLHQVMRNKRLRPFLNIAEEEGLLDQPGE